MISLNQARSILYVIREGNDKWWIYTGQNQYLCESAHKAKGAIECLTAQFETEKTEHNYVIERIALKKQS